MHKYYLRARFVESPSFYFWRAFFSEAFFKPFTVFIMTIEQTHAMVRGAHIIVFTFNFIHCALSFDVFDKRLKL